MGDEAPASLANADKHPTALGPSPKRPDGPVLREKETSTLAPGQNGSAMPLDALMMVWHVEIHYDGYVP
jgi:hypothetical protein